MVHSHWSSLTQTRYWLHEILLSVGLGQCEQFYAISYKLFTSWSRCGNRSWLVWKCIPLTYPSKFNITMMDILMRRMGLESIASLKHRYHWYNGKFLMASWRWRYVWTRLQTWAPKQDPMTAHREQVQPPALMVVLTPSTYPEALNNPCRADWKVPGKSTRNIRLHV